MTDVVVHQGRSSLEIAPDAWTLAQRIAATDFVPTAFRGKPEAVLAAMLTGHELGISPLQSLAKINVIEGKPSIAAELMRALVLRAGHDLWVEESSGTKCTVVGRRKGSDHQSRVTWTLDDAKRAGLEGRQNWRKYPRAMLLARASSELVRQAFPEYLAGVSYSVEELTDGDMVNQEDLEAPELPVANGTKRKAARAAVAVATPETVNAGVVIDVVPNDSLPPLPGEEAVDASPPVGVTTEADEGSGGAETPPEPPANRDDWSIKQLKESLELRKLPVEGTRAEMIARLKETDF